MIRLADRAFRRPHPPRFLAEEFLVRLDRPAKVFLCVLGVALEVRRQADVGHRPTRQSLVQQQRQDGVIERRGGQLDLSPLHQFAVQRHDLAEQLHLPVQQPLLFLLRPAAALAAELVQFGVLLEGQRMDPHQVRPTLQIDDVLLVKSLPRFLGRVDRQPPLFVQLEIAREGANHLVRMDHEEIVQQVVQVVFAEAVGRQPRDAEMRVLLPPIGVGRQLLQEAGDQIDRGVQFGRFLQQHRHAPIVLGPVQADPGHGIFAGYVVGIIRLMLMPEKGQRDFVHGGPSPSE